MRAAGLRQGKEARSTAARSPRRPGQDSEPGRAPPNGPHLHHLLSPRSGKAKPPIGDILVENHARSHRRLRPTRRPVRPSQGRRHHARRTHGRKGKMTVGADRGYNTRGFVGAAGSQGHAPSPRSSAATPSTAAPRARTECPSQRKVAEEPCWMKNVGGLRKLLPGTRKVSAVFTWPRGLQPGANEYLMAKPTLETETRRDEENGRKNRLFGPAHRTAIIGAAHRRQLSTACVTLSHPLQPNKAKLAVFPTRM